MVTGPPAPLSPTLSHRRPPAARAGFSMVEAGIAAVLLMVALAGLSSSVVSSLQTGTANDERAAAAKVARRIAETLESESFEKIFASFNSDPNDGTGAGYEIVNGGFDVPGLEPVEGDPDGKVGRIVFPELLVGPKTELREDVFLPALSMPRDLNGDGEIDTEDHSEDYILLPVGIRVEWRGAAGDYNLQLDLLLVN